jgi:hypothetical protein
MNWWQLTLLETTITSIIMIAVLYYFFGRLGREKKEIKNESKTLLS